MGPWVLAAREKWGGLFTHLGRAKTADILAEDVQPNQSQRKIQPSLLSLQMLPGVTGFSRGMLSFALQQPGNDLDTSSQSFR